MDQTVIYIALLGVSLIVGLLFYKTPIPIPLMLVITGMLVGFLPGIPEVSLSPELILNIFLPLLLYPASAFLSWNDVKQNLRPIILLSIGHVFFIAVLIAVLIHALIPFLSWPLAFILGACVAPPDDLAILAIAEKINFPSRVITILKGESMLNDATALILFRFSLAALLTHYFSPVTAVSAFFWVIVGETAYGFILGHFMGRLRMKIRDPMLQMMASFLTPFLAYLPPERLGGCGVLATVVTGFVIGHQYLEKLSPENRLTGRAVWTSLSYMLQSVLFLLAGLNFRYTLQHISSIPLLALLKYSGWVIAVVIIGRFIWVYPSVYLPRLLFPAIRKKDPSPPWQLPFIVSWSGMRGVISLAAALAIPALPNLSEGINPKDLIIFLVFSVIIATLLIQGLTLPWLLKTLGLHNYSKREKYKEHLTELAARVNIARQVLRWLLSYKKEVRDNQALLDKVKLRIREYQLRCKQLEAVLENHHDKEVHDEAEEQRQSSFLSAQINELERNELLRLWHDKQINFEVRTKLLQQLDHRFKHITG